MLPSFVRRARVPPDPSGVTTIRPGEADPRDVGVPPEGVEDIWRAVERLYGSGIHPAIQLCVRRHGRVILDRAIGHATGNGPDDAPGTPKVLATPDTPFCVLSASKAITAMMVHLLDQQNLIRLDDPVCEYIPEFGRCGKEWTTIRHVLTHRAGIQNLPPEVMRLERLDDLEEVMDILCEAEPVTRAGRQLAYHAVTGGFVLGEVVHRVTGRTIRQVLDAAIRRPLGFRWLSYGVEPEDVGRVATNYVTGPPVLPPFSQLFRRALGVGFREAVEMSNDARFLTGLVPSAQRGRDGGRAQPLLPAPAERRHPGRRARLRRAHDPPGRPPSSRTCSSTSRSGCRSATAWASCSAPTGSACTGQILRHAFGHLGFTNVICWADPERQVAAALMTSGKPFVYPELYYLYEVLRQIGRACAKAPGRGGDRRLLPGPKFPPET